MISHTKNRTQVSSGRPIIRTMQQTIEISGSKRNERNAEGALSVRLLLAKDDDAGRHQHESEQRTDIRKFREQYRYPRIPAGMPTTNPAIQVLNVGRLEALVHAENMRGSRRSRDIANQMRAWPY